MAEKLTTNVKAPQFELTDTRGDLVRLSTYRGRSLVLVLLRGFM